MKKVWLGLSLLTVIALLVGCGSGGQTQGLSLGSAPWKDGEQALYDVVDKSGNKIGTSTRAFTRDGNAWVLDEVDAAAGVNQAAKVRIDAGTLKALGEEKTIRAPQTDVTLNTTYANGKLEIRAVVNGKNQSVTIDVPANGLDSDQLLETLRALPFAEGYKAKLVTVVGANAAKINTTVQVKGKEKVEVPAGSLEAWRVELTFGQAKQTAWYEVEAPFRMVQYDNGQTKLVLR